MGKRDKELRKRKERERKVAKRKVREREERRAAERKAREEEALDLLRERFQELRSRGILDGEEAGSGENPYELERFQRYLRKASLLAGYDPENLTETQESGLIRDWESKWAKILADDPVEAAQDIMVRALEESDAADMDEWEATARPILAARAREALDLDPDNVDAILVMGNLAFDTYEEEDREAFRLLREAVRKGRDALGAAFFDRWRESLHTRFEARPFLRALQSLADHLDGENRLEEAVPVLEELLACQPGRADSTRKRLLDAYLALGRLDAARRLLETRDAFHPEEARWAWMLLELQAGRPEAAEDHLKAALRAFPGPPSYLRDWTGEESRLPDLIRRENRAFGDEPLSLGRAWRRTPGAMEWLQEKMSEDQAGAPAAEG